MGILIVIFIGIYLYFEETIADILVELNVIAWVSEKLKVTGSYTTHFSEYPIITDILEHFEVTNNGEYAIVISKHLFLIFIFIFVLL